MNPPEAVDLPSAWFVVEGGARTGWGHLSRSLHLAEAWCRAGGAATCIGALDADAPGDWFPPSIPLVRLPESLRTTEDRANWFAARLRRSRPDWLVLDGYDFDEAFAAALRRLGPGLVRLDDPTLPANLAPPRAADLLVLPGPFPPEFVPERPAGRVLAGLEYLLVRPLARGPESPAEPDDACPAPFRLLATFGGADPYRRAETLAAALRLLPPGICRATLLVPPRSVEALRRASLTADPPGRRDPLGILPARCEAVEILPGRRDWGDLLDRADAVWCAAGTTAWEVVTAGKPCGVSLDAENQRFNHAALIGAGLARDLGRGAEPTPARWAELLRSWAAQPVLQARDTSREPSEEAEWIHSRNARAASENSAEKLHALSGERPQTLSLQTLAAPARRPDGRGAERIVAAMRRAVVRLRPAAGNDDLEALFAWANDPDTRAASRRTEPIERAAHESWFERCLARPAETWLRIAVDGTGRRLGTIRFDRSKTPGVWWAALALDPTVRGQGWSGRLIRLATAELAAAPPGEIRVLRAAIKPWNERSRRAFAGAGYVRSRAPAPPDCDLFDLDPHRPM